MSFYKLLILSSALLLVCSDVLAFSQLLTLEGGLPIQWDIDSHPAGIPYYINQTGTGDACVADYSATFQESFDKWNSIPTSRAGAAYMGTTTRSYGDDGQFVILFVSGDPRVRGSTLASTFYWYRVSTGEMLEVDIAFNDDYEWTTDSACGGPGVYDLRSVSTHEAGHFFGLDHSALGRYAGSWDNGYMATMYPYYFGAAEMTIEQDDMAGLSSIYPVAGPLGLGRIRGRVLKCDDDGLFAVHVVALTESGKEPVVSSVSDKYGRYDIFGLPPGAYHLLAESPYISSDFYTEYLSSPSYYRSPDRLESSWLYKKVEVVDQADLADGSAIFEDARAVQVAADEVKRDVDFPLFHLCDKGGDYVELKFDFDADDLRRCGQISGGFPSSAAGHLVIFLPALFLCLRIFLFGRRK